MEQVGNVCTLVCIYHVQANARKKLEKGLWVVRVQEPQSKRAFKGLGLKYHGRETSFFVHVFCHKEFLP